MDSKNTCCLWCNHTLNLISIDVQGQGINIAEYRLMLFHDKTWGVAGKVNGVVITSPERRKL